jgi:predicted ATP-dependent protease
VGQINGLAVFDLGDHSFGMPSRITAKVFVGKKGIVSIDREVRLSGAIHDKGALILTGYMGGRYAQELPLAFSASITFEQMYSGVEGDSASATELYALLSALSELPIDQGIAVTGSVNQLGEIQPVGGINEKIEGMYKICKLQGLNKKQGVIIPRRNVINLMLSQEVIAAVKAGIFHIYAVETVDQAMELLTGVKAGIKMSNGNYPAGSINERVQKRLFELATIVEKHSQLES